jgi:hypothetical protein
LNAMIAEALELNDTCIYGPSWNGVYNAKSKWDKAEEDRKRQSEEKQ